MSLTLDMASEVGRLLSYGLRPRLRPAREPDYADLLRRYQTEAPFKTFTEGVAEGLGLIVLDAGEHGLILGASESSPFALKLSDYRQNMTVEDRVCHGLIQLSIAAWCFPSAEELEDTQATVKRLSNAKIVEYLLSLCQEFQRGAQAEYATAQPELREAWRVILNRAETRSTSDGRRTATSINGMVAYALESLERAGLLRKVGDEEGGSWHTLQGYRVQVRELAAHKAFSLIQEAGRKGG